MKNLKTLLLPAVMVLAGAGSAYATHVSKSETNLLPMGYAYHADENPVCVPANKECAIGGDITCTADVGRGLEPLFEINGTVCTNDLSEKINK